MEALKPSICEVLVRFSVVRTLSEREGENPRVRKRRESTGERESVCVFCLGACVWSSPNQQIQTTTKFGS